jgi:CheY-like chemotaxis protein
MIAKAALEGAGFRVLLAEDGRQALDLFAAQSQAFAAGLLDLTMPKLSGLQALEELQRLNPRVRVVLSSGYTEQDVAQQLADGAVAGFLRVGTSSHILRGQRTYFIARVRQGWVFTEPLDYSPAK